MLLEVILSLALSLLVLAALWGAVDFQLRAVSVGRAEAEAAQLARALLGRMATDLRSTVVYSPTDTSALEEFIANAGLDSITSAIEDTTDLEGLEGEDPLGEEPMEDETDPLDPEGGLEEEGLAPDDPAAELDPEAAALEADGSALAESFTPKSVPGLYGSAYDLQVDVSHLPRVDQYEQTLLASNMEIRDTASDLKTIAYFVIPESAVGTGQTLRAPGLYRREVDRAVTLFAAEMGDSTALDEAARPLAPEVVGMQMRYFDGTSWFGTWDSSSSGARPLAVEIALAIQVNRPPPSYMQSMLTDQPPPRPVRVYRLLVPLPSAQSQEPVDPLAVETLETGTTSSSASGGF